MPTTIKSIRNSKIDTLESKTLHTRAIECIQKDKGVYVEHTYTPMKKLNN